MTEPPEEDGNGSLCRDFFTYRESPFKYEPWLNFHKTTDLEDHNSLCHQEGHKEAKDTVTEMVSPGKQASLLLLSSGYNCLIVPCPLPRSQTFKKSSSFFIFFFIGNFLPPNHPGPVVEGVVGAEKRPDGFKATWEELGEEFGAQGVQVGARSPEAGTAPRPGGGARRAGLAAWLPGAAGHCFPGRSSPRVRRHWLGARGGLRVIYSAGCARHGARPGWRGRWRAWPRDRGRGVARGRRQWTGARAFLAALQPPPPGPASPRGWRTSAPGLRSAVGAPRCAPGIARGAGAACATTLCARGTRRPGAGSAGQVTFPGPGWGFGEGRGQPCPDSCPRRVPRRCRNPRWVWSAGAGEKLRWDQPQQAPPERPAPHGQHVARFPSPSPATPSLPPPRLLLTNARDPPPPGSHPGPLKPLLLGTCGPQRPIVSPALPAALQPPSHVAGRQAGWELAVPSRKLQSICNALSLIGSSRLNFNKAFVSSRLIVKASIRPSR